MLLQREPGLLDEGRRRILVVVLATTVLAIGLLTAKVIIISWTKRALLMSEAYGALLEVAVLLASAAWLINMFGVVSVFGDNGEAVSLLPVRQVRHTDHGVINLVPAWIAPTVVALFVVSGLCLVLAAGAAVRRGKIPFACRKDPCVEKRVHRPPQPSSRPDYPA
ncbi:hypothetical protein [Streptomyces dysideae]|uniref:hypothetical protein n=1 Tax=Streptomyces dysideae TaxID=909626 RepID=UPI00131D5015|nr:hypothetical protein [Streptomyces dysideae]